MSNLYENIENLCAQNNTNITQMCKKLNIVRSVLSELSSGRTKSLSSENKSKIAAFFKVDVEYLDKDFANIPCPLCGLFYVPSQEGEISIHESRHKKWLKAVKYFGFCWNTTYRENAKSRARNMLRYEISSLTESEKVECYETIYKALFSRALESIDYSLDSISFEDYVAAILYNKKGNVPDENTDEYKALVRKYGVKKGNVSGTYFDTSEESCIKHFNPSGTYPKTKQVEAKQTNLTPQEETLLERFRNLNNQGQEDALKYLNLLQLNPEYKKPSESRMYIVAESTDNRPSEIRNLTDDELKRIKAAKPVTSDDDL